MFSHTLLFVIYFRTPNLYGYLMYISIWSITAYHAFSSFEGIFVVTWKVLVVGRERERERGSNGNSEVEETTRSRR